MKTVGPIAAPIIKEVGCVVGPAIGGLVATCIAKGFMSKKKEDRQCIPDLGAKDKPRKKDAEKKPKSKSDLKPKKDIILTKDKNKEKNKNKGSGKKKPGKNDKKDPAPASKPEDKKPGDKNQEEKHPNGIYEEAPYHHQNSQGKKSPAPKDGQKALDNSIPVDKKGNSKRRISVNEGEIVVLDSHEPGKYHGHVRDYKNLDNDAKAALHKHGKVDLRGKILE